jgi:hypothetical protein
MAYTSSNKFQASAPWDQSPSTADRPAAPSKDGTNKDSRSGSEQGPPTKPLQ